MLVQEGLVGILKRTVWQAKMLRQKKNISNGATTVLYRIALLPRRTGDKGQGAKNRGQRTGGKEQGTKDRGQRTVDKGQGTKNRGQRTGDRGEWTEDKGQRTRGRRQGT